MKQICEFETALNYALHLGFQGSPSNSIAVRQSDLCGVVDLLLKAAGGVYPYKVRFSTWKNGEFCYPFLGTFTIIRADGTKWELHMGSKHFWQM